MIWVSTVIQGILLGGLYALFACGLSLMLGVMKVINLAHGDLAVLAAYLALGVVAVVTIPALYSFVLVVPIFAVAGYFIQRTLIQASLNRGVLTTPSATNYNMSLFKRFRVWERFNFELRGEAYNIGSNTHFAVPVTNLQSANFGRSLGYAPGAGPRQFNVAARLLF